MTKPYLRPNLTREQINGAFKQAQIAEMYQQWCSTDFFCGHRETIPDDYFPTATRFVRLPPPQEAPEYSTMHLRITNRETREKVFLKFTVDELEPVWKPKAIDFFFAFGWTDEVQTHYRGGLQLEYYDVETTHVDLFNKLNNHWGYPPGILIKHTPQLLDPKTYKLPRRQETAESLRRLEYIQQKDNVPCIYVCKGVRGPDNFFTGRNRLVISNKDVQHTNYDVTAYCDLQKHRVTFSNERHDVNIDVILRLQDLQEMIDRLNDPHGRTLFHYNHGGFVVTEGGHIEIRNIQRLL